MKSRVIILSLVFLGLFTGRLTAAQEFTLSANLPTLKLSYKDVNDIINKVSNIIASANGEEVINPISTPTSPCLLKLAN